MIVPAVVSMVVSVVVTVVVSVGASVIVSVKYPMCACGLVKDVFLKR